MPPEARWVSASLDLEIFCSGSIETVLYALVWNSPLPMIYEFGVLTVSQGSQVFFLNFLIFLFATSECSSYLLEAVFSKN